jgi:hypothetical protein
LVWCTLLGNGWNWKTVGVAQKGFFRTLCMYMFASLLIVVIDPYPHGYPIRRCFIGKGNLYFVSLDDQERSGGNCLCYDMTYS